MTRRNLDLVGLAAWVFLLYLTYIAAILLIGAGLPYIIGGSVVAIVAVMVAWVLLFQAAQDDARREHQLTLLREQFQQERAHLERDDKVFHHAIEEPR